ncbi:protein tyrosine phosphatase [Telmatocola sphagniphila]|uniref:protein-tyrosine-phosphatase n=1 Tax=Telmatocola sphagniphila TaxID=1123043 RepID=A0A8E6EXS5_9BACT|nr:CpsB/CapC family capsule biosynthesis tyrosine phosphatase [Telmatocola sphagniphila]QVL31943.1 protein tyrosine phosphatase [Telmatocola sphagniphila]
MLSFVDLHVHLLWGLDDGPRTLEDALEMCALAVADGTGTAAALAHQNEGWPDNTPERIRQAVSELKLQLAVNQIPLNVVPSSEVMIQLDFEESLTEGKYLTVGDHGRFLLVELPANISLDIRPIADTLLQRNIVPIIAHAERYPDVFYHEGFVEELVHMGCIIQVNAGSITMPQARREEKILKSWFQRNLVHLVASDGHSTVRRPPKIRSAYDRISHWTNQGVADRVCSLHGNIIINNLPWRPLPIIPAQTRTWFDKLFS